VEYENVRFRELIEKQTKQLEYTANDAKFFETRLKESDNRLQLMTSEVEKLNELIRLIIDFS
jgi:hypothetical protein